MLCFTMTSSGDSPGMMSDETSGPDLDGTVTWGALLAENEALLRSFGSSDNPRAEAKWIVEEVTGTVDFDFVDVLETLATVRGVAHLDALVERRRLGEPIQYVLGHWAFRSIDLLVDQRVLIPRPETEVVAGLALVELDRNSEGRGGTVIDLGTGSGAIGLSVATERPGSRVLLTDASRDALAVARANLAGLGLAARGVEIAEGSWFDAVPERYLGEVDVIVSNPPYIGTSEDLASAVRDWEPESALRSGSDGLDDLRYLVNNAARWLAPNGSLVLEMAPGQTATIAALGSDVGFAASVHADLAGLDRAVVLRRA